MAWEIAHAESFPLELGRAPKKVRGAYKNTVLPLLRVAPDKPNPPRVKRLHGYKDLWRIRVSDDYRLVYHCDHKKKVVTLLMLGPRGSIYDRLGAADSGGPGVRIVAQAEDLLEHEPTDEERGLAEIALGESWEGFGHAPDEALPEVITSALLEEWGIPRKFWQTLIAAKTEGELLASSGSVPDKVLERVISALWPPLIEEIVQMPIRVPAKAEDLESAADGLRDLDSFLLQLDDEQAAFVARFSGDKPVGPWLLKGGPGSGKSTVALYCIQSLARKREGQLDLGQKQLRILFTTFTKSLTNASEHLGKCLGLEGSRHHVDHANIDSLAGRHLPQSMKGLRPIDSMRAEAMLDQVVAELRRHDKDFPFVSTDVSFLNEEFDWVIGGDALGSLESYLKADRAGRGRPLTQGQRKQVWKCWEQYRSRLRSQGHWLFGERLAAAAANARPSYDYVFIDEAQDLRPAAMRFAVALCHDRRNVFLTADLNQSIYGHAMSWSKVAEELKFTGRTRILRRSYRNTSQVWEAIKQLAPDGQGVDEETLDVEPVYSGPYPVLARFQDQAALAQRLNSFLHDALIEERVAPGCAAVLCPGVGQVEMAVRMIDPSLNPKAMRAKDFDVSHPGVKVTNMHAAKGLQFPVVVVFGVRDGVLPRRVRAAADAADTLALQRRLLFVACSRAMRQLLVFSDLEKPSPFLANVTDDCWVVEDL